jgi:enamine deaminase RidA (YjgF/YER057c/UK114 family)
MIDSKLTDLGLVLPAAPAAAGSYVGFKIVGNLVIVSGQLPLKDGKPVLVGRLGASVSIEAAYEAAQQCALNVLAQLKIAVADDWTRVVQVVRLGGFVNCMPDFNDAPKVVNGASDLMVKLFGPAGTHARAAVGVASLPAGVAVEIEAMFEIRS